MSSAAGARSAGVRGGQVLGRAGVQVPVRARRPIHRTRSSSSAASRDGRLLAPVVSGSQACVTACQDCHAARAASADCWIASWWCSARPSWRARPARVVRSSSLLWAMMAAASALCRQLAAAEGDGQSGWPGGRWARWRRRAAVAVAPAHSSATGRSVLAGGPRGGRRRPGARCWLGCQGSGQPDGWSRQRAGGSAGCR